MIEIGNHPAQNGAALLHSTVSGGFLALDRDELAALCAAARNGQLDPFLRGEVSSVTADGLPHPPPG
jgi:hypothetical protein